MPVFNQNLANFGSAGINNDPSTTTVYTLSASVTSASVNKFSIYNAYTSAITVKVEVYIALNTTWYTILNQSIAQDETYQEDGVLILMASDAIRCMASANGSNIHIFGSLIINP